MKTRIYIALLLGFSLGIVKMSAQDLQLSDKVASYTMHIALDTESKKLDAKTQLRWKNISDEPIDELYFHMYYNAFKNSRSTFFTERGVPEFLTSDIDDVCGWGWTNISLFKDQFGNVLTDSLLYVQTDDDNIYDQSVLKVKLKEAVPPGETHIFDFEWEAKIPKTMPRTGHNKDFYFFAQWFPKLGVLEPAGMRFAEQTQWNCHQYHSNGEYYSNFGDYDVHIKVPSDFIVAASGALKSKEVEADSTTWQYFANDVIDFTWTCSPHFIKEEFAYKNTSVQFYTYPYKAHLAERYFKTIEFAMAYLEEYVGPYPYSTLSIIDPPIHGMFTGGMEYPTLITSLSFEFFPDGFRTPETLAVHEYIHQYFMQMVASHEVEEAWMDEGITSYYESRILDAYLGENSSTIDFMGFKTGNKKFNRVEYFGMDHPSIASNSIKSWEYKHGGYGEIAYNKAALWLQTMEGLLGQEVMDKVMQSYFETWKFNHPSRKDFIAVVDSVVVRELPDRFPEGMSWFFDQVLYGTGTCDYAVNSITNTRTDDHRGVFEMEYDCESMDHNTKKYNAEVAIHRLDELYFPVEVLLRFEDGTEQIYNWDGKDRAHTIKINTDSKIVFAEIDPSQKIYIDKNFNNNVLQLAPQTGALDKIAAQMFVRLQSLLEFISFAI